MSRTAQSLFVVLSLSVLYTALAALPALPRYTAKPRGAGPTDPIQIRVSITGHFEEYTITWLTWAPTATSQCVFTVNSGAQISVMGSQLNFTDPNPKHTLRVLHTVVLTGVPADSVVSYMVGDVDGGFSAERSFRSVPAGTEVVNMVVYGDFGLTNSQSLKMVTSEVSSGDVDMILHIGDWAYNLNDEEGAVGDAFLAMIENITTTQPYIGCLGNHEDSFNFSHWTNRFPDYTILGANSGSNNNWWYSWDYVSGGALVHMVAVSSELYYHDELLPQLIAQYQWLQNDLETARKNSVDWLIVYCHRPMYCSNVDDMPDCSSDAETLRLGVNVSNTIQYGLEALLDSYQVDIYFTAHEHSYERTWPVMNGKFDTYADSSVYVSPTRPVHIVTGSAGCPEQLDYYDDVMYGPWSVLRSASYGYGHLRVHNRTHLHWDQQLDEGRAGTDQLWIVRQ